VIQHYIKISTVEKEGHTLRPFDLVTVSEVVVIFSASTKMRWKSIIYILINVDFLSALSPPSLSANHPGKSGDTDSRL